MDITPNNEEQSEAAPVDLRVLPPPPERALNQITREDITFTVTRDKGETRVVGMLNIGSAQTYKDDEYPEASPKQLNDEAMDSICRGAAQRIYGKVRADALTAFTEGLRILNATIGVKSESIMRFRALMEPLVEAGSELAAGLSS